MKMVESYLNGQKTLWEKEKLLVTSNFSLSHSVFKRLELQTRKNQGLFGKELKRIFPNTPVTHSRKRATEELRIRSGVTQKNDPPPPLQNDPWVISLRRGMIQFIILRREMTPDRRERTPL